MRGQYDRSIFKTSHLVSLIPVAKFSKLVLHCLFSLAVALILVIIWSQLLYFDMKWEIIIEKDSDYCILHLDDRKFKSHLLQVLLKNGSSDVAIVQ